MNMKKTIKKIQDHNRQMGKDEETAIHTEIINPATDKSRRGFLKKTALGG
jgi:hypothetical protein